MKKISLNLISILLALASGVLITPVIFLIVVLTDTGDSMLPLLERHPFAWVFFWPELVLHLFSIKDSLTSLWLAFVFNVFIYSLMAYLILIKRSVKRLP